MPRSRLSTDLDEQPPPRSGTFLIRSVLAGFVAWTLIGAELLALSMTKRIGLTRGRFWVLFIAGLVVVGCDTGDVDAEPVLTLLSEDGTSLGASIPTEVCRPVETESGGDDSTQGKECVGVGGPAIDVAIAEGESIVVELPDGWTASAASGVDLRTRDGQLWEMGPFLVLSTFTVVAESNGTTARWDLVLRPDD